MKILISFFIFLIGFLAPAQAINFAVPAQIGSYSNPIEPIKPKAKTYKWGKKPIENKTTETNDAIVIGVSVLFALALLAGLIFFSIGFLSSISLWYWLGLGLEIFSITGLVLMLIYALLLDSWDALLPGMISFFGIPISLSLKGLLLIILGLVVSANNVWLLGLGLLLLGGSLLFWIISSFK